MTTTVLLRSGMMGNYHVPFWRAVEEVTPSLTLIILQIGLATAGHVGSWEDDSRNVSGEIDLCLGESTPPSKSARGKRKSKA